MNIRDLFTNLDRSAIEKWCRSQTQVAYLGDHRALCRVLGKYLMYVDTRDLSLAPHMMMNGFWEMWVTQAIVDYVKPGMRCIDVGANCGYYTLLLADLVGEKGMVTAYELQEQLVDRLLESLTVCGYREHAHAKHRAASDTLGIVKMFENERLSGSASLTRAPGLFLGKEQIHSLRLSDDILLAVDFVKIDVQGHELKVLKGMTEMIDRSPKIAIAMEFSPSEHEDPLAALAQISSMGLRIQAIGTDGQVRPILPREAATPDTGDHRMLWLTREG